MARPSGDDETQVAKIAQVRELRIGQGSGPKTPDGHCVIGVLRSESVKDAPCRPWYNPPPEEECA